MACWSITIAIKMTMGDFLSWNDVGKGLGHPTFSSGLLRSANRYM